MSTFATALPPHAARRAGGAVWPPNACAPPRSRSAVEQLEAARQPPLALRVAQDLRGGDAAVLAGRETQSADLVLEADRPRGHALAAAFPVEHEDAVARFGARRR